MSAHKQRLLQALSHANNYQEWLAIAQELDQLDGYLDWRASDGAAFFHENLIKEHIQKMQALRQSGDLQHLAVLLQESVYRHLGELNNPALYQYARSGTKYIVGQYLDEVEQVMRSLSQQKIPQMSEQQKLALFEQAERVYGRPALMLSGGAAFGIYHLGVTKALWDAQLLPKIIAGSSMGAIVAAAVCNRSDAELDIFYREQLSDIHRHAIRWRSPAAIKKYKTALDEAQVFEHIVTNVGSATFLEAYQRSGRVLNISVSPTRTHQKPRILNYLTAPNVLIEYAAQASCAIPYMFPPVALQAKSSSGQKVPYMSTETWIDGTIHGDLPKERLARLHNVNQTIVSQANPHVIPFITHKKQRGVQAIGKHIVSSLIHTTSAEFLDISKHLFQKTPLSPVFNQAHAVAAQSYLGDINIQFPFSFKSYLQVIANPSPAGLVNYIRMGEQATWPQIAMINDLTRISRVFPACIATIKQRIWAETQNNVPK